MQRKIMIVFEDTEDGKLDCRLEGDLARLNGLKKSDASPAESWAAATWEHLIGTLKKTGRVSQIDHMPVGDVH